MKFREVIESLENTDENVLEQWVKDIILKNMEILG